MNRIFLIVLDSLGIGALPDAAAFGDEGANTLKSIASSENFSIPNLLSLGFGNIEGVDLPAVETPLAAFGRMAEQSNGKDTTTGHWEIAGLYSPTPMHTFPEGFPAELITAFEEKVGRKILCNKPYSGTEVIADYGEEHLKTGALIVYTSADSVFQIAAHEELIPPAELYEICLAARELLTGPYAVGRVIARPFMGSAEEGFTRTGNRRDFSVEPHGKTVLDALKESGKEVISVGKISDIFAGVGITRAVPSHNNTEGMDAAISLAKENFRGLCFINLVDFDSSYGHRNDIDGYAKALSEFDLRLGEFLPLLREDDLLIITADHGCDPGDISTDHTREYVPLLVYGKKTLPVSLGTRDTFSDIAATLASLLGADYPCGGKDMSEELFGINFEALAEAARKAAQSAYAPYSGFQVGAALLTEENKLYTGCNIENASFSPTVCAERTALFKAVSEGERKFKAIAVAGGKGGKINGICTPCGVCRQALSEFCSPDMPVVLAKGEGFMLITLGELLPMSFEL